MAAPPPTPPTSRSSRSLLLGVLASLAVAGAVAGVAWLRATRPPAEAAPDPAWLARRDQLVAEWAADRRAASTLREADAAAAAGLGRKAMRRARQVLVEAPAQPDAWLRLAAWSARWPEQGALAAPDRAMAVAAAQADAPDHPLLPGARAWALLAERDPEGARLAAAAAPPGEVLALSAALQASLELGLDAGEAALALHRAAPDDMWGCEHAARASLARGDLAGTDDVVQACLARGVQHPALHSLLATALDLAGEPAEACRAWLAGGARLHAVAVQVQDGACPPGLLPAEAVAEALDQPFPEALLHATWAALIAGDAALAEQRAGALATSPAADEPPFRLARAAALVAAGLPEASLAVLEGLASAEAAVLRGRAHAALGRRDEASAALAQATALAPWRLPAWRERLAHAASQGPEATRLVGAELAQADPVALALARLEPDRLQPWGALAPSPWPERGLPPEVELLRLAVDPPAPRLPARLASVAAGAQGGVRLHLLASAALGGLDPAALPAPLTQPAADADAATRAVQALLAGAPPTPPAAEGRAGERTPPLLRWAAAEAALRAGEIARARSEADALVAEHPDLPGARGWRYSVELEARRREAGRREAPTGGPSPD